MNLQLTNHKWPKCLLVMTPKPLTSMTNLSPIRSTHMYRPYINHLSTIHWPSINNHPPWAHHQPSLDHAFTLIQHPLVSNQPLIIANHWCFWPFIIQPSPTPDRHQASIHRQPPRFQPAFNYYDSNTQHFFPSYQLVQRHSCSTSFSISHQPWLP